VARAAAAAAIINGAKPGPGRRADEEDVLKQYCIVWIDISIGPDSKPALVILSMEGHGSWSQGTSSIAYWDARIKMVRDSLREVITAGQIARFIAGC
jgi:hypothetical protein